MSNLLLKRALRHVSSVHHLEAIRDRKWLLVWIVFLLAHPKGAAEEEHRIENISAVHPGSAFRGLVSIDAEEPAFRVDRSTGELESPLSHVTCGPQITGKDFRPRSVVRNAMYA